MTVSIGVLGTGRIGVMHAELIAQRIPGARLAGVYDVMPESSNNLAARLGCKAFASPDELMSSSEVDAIAICTSTNTHVDLLVIAAKYRKPTFCEKPVSLTLSETDRALRAVSESNTPVMMGFNRRFDPAHRAVRDRVADGTLGEVHLVRITSRDPAPPPLEYAKVSGGIFVDMTIHDFDMARYVTGSEIVQVYAIGDLRIVPSFKEANDLDTVALTLVHANGAITQIDNSRQAVYGYDQRVEAFGSKGLAASENPYSHTSLVRSDKGTAHTTIPYFFLERYIPSYLAEWNEFLSVVNGSKPSVGVADGRASLVAGLAAWKSYHEQRPVKTSEIG